MYLPNDDYIHKYMSNSIYVFYQYKSTYIPTKDNPVPLSYNAMNF